MPMPREAAPYAPPAIPQLMEVAHVAHRLSVSDEHVYRLIRAKELVAIRFGRRLRIDQRDLQAFIDTKRRRDDEEG
jgi:excisionase family DNA binding protein